MITLLSQNNVSFYKQMDDATMKERRKEGAKVSTHLKNVIYSLLFDKMFNLEVLIVLSIHVNDFCNIPDIITETSEGNKW